jgi:hypothetical protein
MKKYLYDSKGNLASQTLENPSPPQITGQPVRQVVELGNFATFSVVVSDASGVTFQWNLNGTDIPGATGDSLLLTNISAANEGQYSVVVTNSVGTVTSTSASLLLDTDRDGLPDSWETATFGNITSQRSEGDPDTDNVSNLDEFLNSTDPQDPLSFRPRLIAYSDAGGSVTVSPMKLSYELGEPVTLTANPFPPSVFIGWAGDLQTGDLININPATFPMNGNKTVRAKFVTATPIPPGLIAFWRGETDASDLVGGHDGTFFSGATAIPPRLVTHGKVGKAFSFDGKAYIRVSDSAALKPAQVTLEAWVFPSMERNDFKSIIARGFSTSNDVTWYLGLRNGVPTFYTFSPSISVSGPSVIPPNQWTHLAATFDGTIKRLYVNGIEVATQTGLGPLVYDPAPVPVTIGADWGLNAPTNFFKGWIDEVALYGRALTSYEISAIYNADLAGKNIKQPYIVSPIQLPDGAPSTAYTYQFIAVLGTEPFSFLLSAGALPPGITLSSAGVLSGTPAPNTSGIWSLTVQATDATGIFGEQLCTLKILASVVVPTGLISWWKAEGNAQDVAGTNQGILRNGADFAPGKVGQAFSLNGTTAYIEIPDNPTLRPASLTLEVWVMFDVTSGIRVVFAKPVGTGTSGSYVLWLENESLRGVVGDVSGFGTELQASFSPTPKRWYHLAYTFDDSTKQQILYANGVQIATGTASKSAGYDAQPLLLGRYTVNGVPNYFLQGRIDEAAIYNRALSASEITSIYEAGVAGKRLPVS